MKRVVNLFLSFALLFVLTGCVSIRVTTEVRADKSFTFGYTAAVDTSKFESEEEAGSVEDSLGIDEESLKKFNDAGYSATPYVKDTWRGTTISKTFANIDDVVNKGETFDFTEWGENLTENGMFTNSGKTYKANWVFDFTESADGEEGDIEGSEELTQMIASQIEITYTVTLSQKSISNNATTVSEDGKTLTWNLKYGERNDVKYEFEFPEVKAAATNGNNNILYYAIGGGAALLVLIIVIALIVSKGKKKKNNQNASEQAQPEVKLEPVQPIVTPVEPEVKLEPVQPTVTPVQSEVRVEPVQPTVTPVQPEVRVEPVQPTVTPVQPEVRVEPIQPTVTPVQPQVRVEEVTPQPEVAPILNQQPEIVRPTEPVQQPVEPQVRPEPVEPFFKMPEQPRPEVQPQNNTISLDELMKQQPDNNNQQ